MTFRIAIISMTTILTYMYMKEWKLITLYSVCTVNLISYETSKLSRVMLLFAGKSVKLRFFPQYIFLNMDIFDICLSFPLFHPYLFNILLLS